MRRGIAVVSVLLSMASAAAAFGQENVRVGISPFSPFVITSNGEPRGFSVDLWQAIAREGGLKSDFVTLAGVAEKLQALEQKKVDAAIGGITIKADREERFDFSYPTFRTGLDILVRNEKGAAAIRHRFAEMFARSRLAIAIAFLVLVFVSAHIMWLIERRKGMLSESYPRGVFEGIYWAIVTASTVGYGDKAPVK